MVLKPLQSRQNVSNGLTYILAKKNENLNLFKWAIKWHVRVQALGLQIKYTRLLQHTVTTV
jgi:hypothetical protein